MPDIKSIGALEEPTDVPDSDQALVSLGVYDENTAGPDHDVVDVSAGARDGSVMERTNMGHVGESGSEFRLAFAASRPCASRGRLV